MPRRGASSSQSGRMQIQAVGAAQGLAMGQAQLRLRPLIEIAEKRVPASAIDHQLDRLHCAVDAAREEMRALRDRLRGAMEREVGDILELHALLIDDPELLQNLDALIRSHRYSAEYALQVQHATLTAIFKEMEDPYLQSRMDDLDHVITRIQAFLQHPPRANANGKAGGILISESVSPSELAELQAQGVVGLITRVGSPLSHVAIMARSLCLPLVVSAGDALFHKVNDGDVVIIDGSTGDIIVSPSARDVRLHQSRMRERAKAKRVLASFKHKPTLTADHVEITLRANGESKEDIAHAYAIGCAGLGLYRSEFLALHRPQLPDENAQFHAYRDAIVAMKGRCVTIRTLDLGADKIDRVGLGASDEFNPALGVRGIRLLFKHPNLLKTQLRAILRASQYGPVRILFPMVSSREEIIRLRQLVRRVRTQLDKEGHKTAERIWLGVMIEIPAAAIALATLIEQIDFISVGTNDLIQYLLAADRNNEAVADLYSPLHPAVIQLLHHIVRTAQIHQKPVCLCGEMANNPLYMPLLLGLGFQDFSLHPATLLEIRRTIRGCRWDDLQQQTAALLQARDRRGLQKWLDANRPTHHPQARH